jgi:hypothetical protein
MSARIEVDIAHYLDGEPIQGRITVHYTDDGKVDWKRTNDPKRLRARHAWRVVEVEHDPQGNPTRALVK